MPPDVLESIGGSSPRLWGTLFPTLIINIKRRFIPTPVGNIAVGQLFAIPRQVHPHACGEHLQNLLLDFIDNGSSPRLWGTCTQPMSSARAKRFIPTPVGNISKSSVSVDARSVHPHACGEHSGCLAPIHSIPGSSPRLWGTCFAGADDPHLARFIPTPVGNMDSRIVKALMLKVHPHACGEHYYAHHNAQSPDGSSPRLWGTSGGRSRCPSHIRFIPTPVGNIPHVPYRIQQTAVHPHACGEHEYASQHPQVKSGSSPRLWGTSPQSALDCLSLRFIPTPVGNIPEVLWHPMSVPVHPHACGEHGRTSTTSRIMDGSSPRLWGTSILNHPF